MAAVLPQFRRGFTLIELIVVILILGVLAALSIVTFTALKDRSARGTVDGSLHAYARLVKANAAGDGVADPSAYLGPLLREMPPSVDVLVNPGSRTVLARQHGQTRQLRFGASVHDPVVVGAVAPAAMYSSTVLARTPLRYWPLDGQGTAVPDATGSSPDGAVISGAALGRPGALLAEPGTAASIVTGRVNLPALSVPADWTLLLYARMPFDGGFNGVNYFVDAASGHGFAIDTNPDGTLRARLDTPALINQYLTAPQPVNIKDNRWHQLVLSKSGATIRLHLDGVSYATRSLSGTLPATVDQVWLGDSPWGSRWRGEVDEVSFYGRALTDAEIAADFAASRR